MSTHPLLNVATRAARSASRVLFRSFDRLEDNLLTPVRRRALASKIQHTVASELTNQIQNLYPEHEIIGANDPNERTDAEHRWILSPVDSFENLQRGLPRFAICIAYQLQGKTTIGLVHDPIQDETFSAIAGQGALLNQKRIRTNQNVKALSGALIAGNKSQSIGEQITGSHCSGSESLDIVYVAAGRLDGFYNISKNEQDLSAAMLIATEASALVTNVAGNEAAGTCNDLVIAHSKLHQQLLAQLR